jgi:hypothetical protein
MHDFAALLTSLSKHGGENPFAWAKKLNIDLFWSEFNVRGHIVSTSGVTKMETGTANDEILITNHLDQSNHLAIQ